MDADPDTLCTALYVCADDELETRPELRDNRKVRSEFEDGEERGEAPGAHS